MEGLCLLSCCQLFPHSVQGHVLLLKPTLKNGDLQGRHQSFVCCFWDYFVYTPLTCDSSSALASRRVSRSASKNSTASCCSLWERYRRVNTDTGPESHLVTRLAHWMHDGLTCRVLANLDSFLFSLVLSASFALTLETLTGDKTNLHHPTSSVHTFPSASCSAPAKQSALLW